MFGLPKISLPKNQLSNIVSRVSKKHLIVALIIGVIAISSGTLLLASHSTNKKTKELAFSSKVKPTPTIKPTNTPTPTFESYHHPALIQSTTPIPTNEAGSPTAAQPQTNDSNNSANYNSPTSSITQPTNSAPKVVNSAPASAPDCSGISGGIASIKNTYQPLIDQATTNQNNVNASRGIVSDSGTGQQQMFSVLNPIYAQENAQIAAFCANYVNTGCNCP